MTATVIWEPRTNNQDQKWFLIKCIATWSNIHIYMFIYIYQEWTVATMPNTIWLQSKTTSVNVESNIYKCMRSQWRPETFFMKFCTRSCPVTEWETRRDRPWEPCQMIWCIWMSVESVTKQSHCDFPQIHLIQCNHQLNSCFEELYII